MVKGKQRTFPFVLFRPNFMLISGEYPMKRLLTLSISPEDTSKKGLFVILAAFGGAAIFFVTCLIAIKVLFGNPSKVEARMYVHVDILVLVSLALAVIGSVLLYLQNKIDKNFDQRQDELNLWQREKQIDREHSENMAKNMARTTIESYRSRP